MADETATFRYWFKTTPRADTLIPELWDRDGQTVTLLQRFIPDEGEPTVAMWRARFSDGYEHDLFEEEVDGRVAEALG